VEPQFVDILAGTTIADEQWYLAQKNGGSTTPHLEQENSWAPQNLADLEDRPPVQPTLGGLGIVYPGKRHWFSGPQESAKTLAAYVIGLEVVRTGMPVILIDFEMGPWDARTRLRELGASDDELAAFRYVEPDTPSTPERIGALVDLEPGLVLVDAAAGAFSLEGLDDNARKDVERWANAWVTPFWRAGVATIVLDHVTKNAETRGNYAIGSERKVGSADVHLGFHPVTPISRGGSGLYKITTHKDRGGCLRRGVLCEFKLGSDPETHHMTWEFVAPQQTDAEHGFRPTVIMEKVSRFLERQMEPVTTNTIIGSDLGKDEYVREALRILSEEGFASVSDGPRRSRLYESIRAYREDSDEAVATASPLRPDYVPNGTHSTASHESPPFRGDVDAVVSKKDVVTASQGQDALLEEDDDGIPF
jgi:hypothetical protein